MRFLSVFLFSLLALPVHALDVSVVDGQSRVNATLNQIQQRVETLSNALEVNSNLLTETSQALSRVRECGSQNMIYDETNDQCAAPPPDPAALSAQLNCQDNEVIIQKGGQLVCQKRLEGCKVCTRFDKYRDTYVVKVNGGGDTDGGFWAECVGYASVSTQRTAANQTECTDVTTSDSLNVIRRDYYGIQKSNGPVRAFVRYGDVLPEPVSCIRYGFNPVSRGYLSGYQMPTERYEDRYQILQQYMQCN